MYDLALFLVKNLVVRLLFRYKAIGSDNIPASGGVILAGNHITGWDPVFVACGTSRRVSYMAKAELFRIPVVGQIIRMVGQFPVKRGTVDRTAIKKAIDILLAGGTLGIFPEGTRHRDGAEHAGLTGVAYFAAKARATIVPIGISLGRGIRPVALVRFGEPIEFGSSDARLGGEVLAERTAIVMQRIRDLVKQNGAEVSS